VRKIVASRRPRLVGDVKMFVYDTSLILRSVWITVRARWEV